MCGRRKHSALNWAETVPKQATRNARFVLTVLLLCVFFKLKYPNLFGILLWFAYAY